MDSLAFPDLATATPAPAQIAKRNKINDRELRRLLPLWEADLVDDIEGTKKLLAILDGVLKQEAQRSVAMHWGYDQARHNALQRIYRAERARLTEAGCTLLP